MKNSLLLTSLLTIAFAGFSGCATDQRQTQGQTHQVKPKDSRPISERIKAGMTKGEVIEAVGNPKGKAMNSDGTETWTYADTQNAFIPFYTVAGGKFHHLTVVFGRSGTVKNWSSSEAGLY